MATSTNAKRFYSPKNGSRASNSNAISTLSKLIPSSRPSSFQVSRRSFASTRLNDGKKAWTPWRFIEPRQGALYDSTLAKSSCDYESINNGKGRKETMTKVTLENHAKAATPPRSVYRRPHIWIAGALGMLFCSTSIASSASAADDAPQILKAMSDYMASQKTISLTFDSDIEVVTPEVEKIQFASSGKMLLARPDKLRVSRTGGYADVDIVFDGKTITALGKNINAFTQMEAGGSIDQLIGKLRDLNILSAPGADFLGTHVFEDLMDGVISAKHIGLGVIDGVECEHLAFRNRDVDWQIWIEVGARPIPRKYVITSKGVGAAPQYTLRIKDWKTDPPIAADAFAFTPPAGASKVALEALENFDEVPHGIVAGGKK
jgi:hypothetical protein